MSIVLLWEHLKGVYSLQPKNQTCLKEINYFIYITTVYLLQMTLQFCINQNQSMCKKICVFTRTWLYYCYFSYNNIKINLKWCEKLNSLKTILLKTFKWFLKNCNRKNINFNNHIPFVSKLMYFSRETNSKYSEFKIDSLPSEPCYWRSYEKLPQ